MKAIINGKVVILPDSEPVEITISPDEYARYVAMEIHNKYSVDDEIAIIRQKDEKPDEYAEYFAYCEECKRKIKALIKV